jgi:hypothetical protein
MKFVCPEHGEVTCKRLGYSCPLTGWCPVCDKMLTDKDDGGVMVMSAEEAKAARPGFPPNSPICVKAKGEVRG